MSERPLEGVKVVEVAMWGFVPSCGALLAEWGADVIKVEHARLGDPQRALVRMGDFVIEPDSVNPAWEHPNHNKRSIGLDVADPEGRKLLGELLADADVFLTSFLPESLAKFRLTVDDVRADNPAIIYALGSALGSKGDEATHGGYDATAFWMRAGIAHAITPRDLDGIIPPPLPAFGDTISGSNLAGGIAAALFKLARTGEPSVVDVSLLSSAVWASGLGLDGTLYTDFVWQGNPVGLFVSPINPVAGSYKTKDGRILMLMMLQAAKFWDDFCIHIDRVDLTLDERFDAPEKLQQNAPAATEILREVFLERTLDEWTQKLRTLAGPWAPVQDAAQVTRDHQVRSNDMIVDLLDGDGAATGHEAVAGPVRFDGAAPVLHRAPGFAEHTDALLAERGIAAARIAALKEQGVLA